MNNTQRWTVLDLINTTTRFFSEKNIDNPRLNAEQLLGHVLKLSRVQLYLAFERPVTEEELHQFRALARRRINREPLQYILGQTEFMGYPIFVNADVLIPRPETELLVTETLQLRDTGSWTNPLILDIGTGSGCIAIALAREWPQSRIIAMDNSAAALHMTEKNIAANQLQFLRPGPNEHFQNWPAASLYLLEQDIHQPWPAHLPDHVDILVSNPPYIAKSELDSLQAEVKDFEPLPALTDFEDGLHFYRRIFQLVSAGGELSCRYLCLEISGSQPQKIIDLASQQKFLQISVIPDWNQIPRILKIKVHNE